jgi:hypothetical protein
MAIAKVDKHVGAAFTQLSEPLGDNNWTAWKTRMVSVLEVCRVRDYVQGTVPSPDAEMSEEDSAAWKFNDSFARTLILNNISDTQVVHVQSATTAKEMWDNLASVHEPKAHYLAFLIQRNLFRACADEDDDIADHLKKLKNLWKRLTFIDDDDFRISDDQFKTIIASSLPPSWDIFTVPYFRKHKDSDENQSKCKIKSQDFIDILIEEYRRRQVQSRVSPQVNGFGHGAAKCRRGKKSKSTSTAPSAKKIKGGQTTYSFQF